MFQYTSTVSPLAMQVHYHHRQLWVEALPADYFEDRVQSWCKSCRLAPPVSSSLRLVYLLSWYVWYPRTYKWMGYHQPLLYRLSMLWARRVVNPLVGVASNIQLSVKIYLVKTFMMNTWKYGTMKICQYMVCHDLICQEYKLGMCDGYKQHLFVVLV